MPQLAVTQNAILAQPGMLFDANRSALDIVSAVAAVNILPGQACEWTGGSTGTGKTVQPLQDANLAAGTVHVTNASTAVSWTGNLTFAAGQAVTFAIQPGVVYYFASAVSNTTSGTLTAAFSGTTSTTTTIALAPYQPQFAGVAMLEALGFEQSYVPWSLQTVLSGTVSVSNGSTNITFSTNQTLAAGSQLVFASQPGAVYFLASAVTASTSGTLTVKYQGTTNGSTTTTIPPGGSNAKGWLAGMPIPLLRKGRIWGLSDGGGTATQTGPVNVWHSSDGTHNQGVFTFSAQAYTAGAEIDVAPYTLAWNPGVGFAAAQTDPFGNTFFVTPIEVNA